MNKEDVAGASREGSDPARAEEDAPVTVSLLERLLPSIENPRDRWRELAAAILLALATVMSAWCAYQATRWSGVQATAFGQAGALRSESVRASTRAGQQVQIDVQSWLAWIDARVSGRDEVADFLHERFRAEFLPAFDAWMDSVQGEPKGTVPEGTPFELPEYQLAEGEKADRLESEAAASFDEARRANQTGDNFVLTAVLYASVLFFAGIGTKWRSSRLRLFSLGLGSIVFVVASFIVFTLPQNVGF